MAIDTTVEYNPNPSSNIIPNMTSDTSPSGICTASSIWYSCLPYTSFRKEDKVPQGGWISHPYTTCWIAYEFPAATTVTGYSFTSIIQGLSYCPKDWTFEGTYDGETWEVLDSHNNFIQNTSRNCFPLANAATYKKYKINMLNNTSGSTVSFSSIEFFGVETKSVQCQAIGGSL